MPGSDLKNWYGDMANERASEPTRSAFVLACYGGQDGASGERGRNGAGDEAPARCRPPGGVQGTPPTQEKRRGVRRAKPLGVIECLAEQGGFISWVSVVSA
jgi:hypothetical protein